MEQCSIADVLTEAQIRVVEADCFGCFSKFLSHIQENYTFAQVGIQRMVFQLEAIMNDIDGSYLAPLRLGLIPDSSPGQALGRTRSLFPPVLFPMDELPSDEGDSTGTCRTHVGYLPR